MKINKATQPGRIQNYLKFIKQFIEFVLCDKPRDVFVGDVLNDGNLFKLLVLCGKK